MKRPLALTALLVALPVPALAKDRKHRVHLPGCASRACDTRIGRKWAKRHPRASAASAMRVVVMPYRAWLDRVGECEDNDNPADGPTGYRSNTGNGFFGRYQFTLSSWAAVGGTGRPDLAPPLEQDFRAVRLLKLQGPGAWPVCSQ